MQIITLTRKPLETSTTTANVLKHGTGAFNIDACRLGFASEEDIAKTKSKNPGKKTTVTSTVYGENRPQQKVNTSGRWPANVILQHNVQCASKQTEPTKNARWECNDRCVIVDLDHQSGISVSSGGRLANISTGQRVYGGGKGLGVNKKPEEVRGDPGFGDVGGASRYFKHISCVTSCAAQELERQSGKSVSRKGAPRKSRESGEGWGMKHTGAEYNDEGSATRFFKLIEESPMTASNDLLRYLQTLITPPDELEPHVMVIESLEKAQLGEIPNQSIHGVILFEPPASYLEELDRILIPGAHLLVISSSQDPIGYKTACSLEEYGYDIRDAIAVLDTPNEFYYVAKANSTERHIGVTSRTTQNGNEVRNSHPTVKPIKIMEHLIEDLPKKGAIVDPFMGSGTTGIACAKLGHEFIGIEQDAEYLCIADQRIRHWSTTYNSWASTKIESEAQCEKENADTKETTLGLNDLFGLK